MSAPDLHTLIKVDGGQVATTGAELDSEPITTVLTTYFGKDALVIADAAITSQPDDADVTVHGDVTLLGVTVTGDARFFIDDDVAQLEFIGTPPGGWTLGASFESLKKTYFDSFALGAPHLGLRSEEVKGWDLCAREHIELWPLAILFLVMGLASPVWMQAIDTYGAAAANHPVAVEAANQAGAFVDPSLAAAAVNKPAPPVNKGAQY